MVDRVACIGCGTSILVSTALKTDGYCRQCRPSEQKLKHLESERKSGWIISIIAGSVAIFIGIGAWVIFLQWRWRMLIWLLIVPIAWGLFAVGKGVVDGLQLLSESLSSKRDEQD